MAVSLVLMANFVIFLSISISCQGALFGEAFVFCQNGKEAGQVGLLVYLRLMFQSGTLDVVKAGDGLLGFGFDLVTRVGIGSFQHLIPELGCVANVIGSGMVSGPLHDLVALLGGTY